VNSKSQQVAQALAHLVPGPVRHAILDQAARELRVQAREQFDRYGRYDTRGIAIWDCADWLHDHAWHRSTLYRSRRPSESGGSP
jgi:hypothetical protein